MLATILVHVPLIVAPLLQPPFPRECQLDVLTPLAIEERAVVEFNANVETYLTVQRRLARALPPWEMFDDEEGFYADELRDALVAARPNARPGAFFTSRVADAFRHRIDIALAYAGGTALPFQPDWFVEARRPAVNEPLRSMPDPFQWSPLVAALPPVPEELAYVVRGRDLVLVDAVANLVIDVLTDAVPTWPVPDVIYR